jgi:DNA repair exonuclease SbcCD nuclease subunit
MRVLFLADTHLGFDLPSHPRVSRRRRGHDFFDSFERALEPARLGQVDVVVHGGDLWYRSRVPTWLAEAALAPLKRVASAGVPVLLVLGNHERARARPRAVVQLRVTGTVPAGLTAGALRAMSGARNVTLAPPTRR